MDRIKAMVLAAGLGTRLRPLTEQMPKALVPVAGRPMIYYPLFWLRDQGIREVVINTHYFSEMLEQELGDGGRLGLSISYSREEELLGTGGGVGKAQKIFGRNRLVLINADTLVDLELKALLDRHRSSGAMATLAVVPGGEESTYTPVLVDGAGRVRRIGSRPETSAAGLNRVIFTGVSVLDPALVDYLPADRFAGLMEQGIVPALEAGHEVGAYVHQGYWRALDDQAGIRAAEAEIRAGRLRPGGGLP